MTHCVQLSVDIETRGKYDNAIITRLAIVPFRFDEDKNTTFKELVDRSLYISLDQDEQVAMGRTTDWMTTEWWDKQSEDLKITSLYPTDEDMSIKDALAEIKRYVKAHHYNFYESFLWARNCGYEYGKLAHLQDTVYPGEKHVLNSWNWHEVKTMNHVLSGGATTKWEPEGMEDMGFNYHQANHDAAMDAYRMIQLWNR